MKCPFTYHGGKQRLVYHIVPMVPNHKIYVEPFCGGATLLFNKKDYITNNINDYREVINDTNKNIHNFFVQLRDNGEELCKKLELSLYSQEEYRQSMSYSGDDPTMKAYYFFINIMQSFCNNLRGGWATGKIGTNQPFRYINKIYKLKEYIDRMRCVFISCEDALRCMQRWDSEDTFFFCDPPYINTNCGHYKGYTEQDFKNLIDFLENCKGSFILSNYPNDVVPKHWEKKEIVITPCAKKLQVGEKRKKAIEILWFRLPKENKKIIDLEERQYKLF